MGQSIEYLYEKSVILERALACAPAVKARQDEEKEEEEVKSSSSKKQNAGYIYTDPEELNKMEPGINKVLLEEFNKRMIKIGDFIRFVVAEGLAPDDKRAKTYANNKIKILREGCDMKFSNILVICKFLNIQVDFIIN